MSALLERIKAAREARDPKLFANEIPYARWLGLDVEVAPEGDIIGILRHSERVVGNRSIPALHGGPLGALLEWTAIFNLLWNAETIMFPKTITISVDYLRPAKPLDTRARAIITRQSRRVANVRIEAFQQDPAKPTTTAHALFLVIPSEMESAPT